MATSTPSRHLLLLVSTMVYLSVSTCKFGIALDDHHLGAAGAVADDFVPDAEDEGERDEYGPHHHEGHEPLFTKALECFNDKYIYSSCHEACRLTQNGEIHVAHEYVDEYCNGPCLRETNLVLDCIDEILKYFVFYNKASVRDVRETINTGCSYGPKRGDFNVAEHEKVYEDTATKLSITSSVVYTTLIIIIVGYHILLA